MNRANGREIAFALLSSGLAFCLSCASSTDGGVPPSGSPSPSDAGVLNELLVANAWIDLTGDESAVSGYFVMQNRGPDSRALVAARSDLCGRVSIRRVVVDAGRWSSTELSSLDVPAGGAVAFVPRGLFLQLDCRDHLTDAESVPITLEFAQGGTVSFDAELRSP